MKEQILVGSLVAVLAAFGLRHDRWILSRTAKGRWLAKLTGEVRGLWLLRILLLLAVTFGTLLAANLIRPIRW